MSAATIKAFQERHPLTPIQRLRAQALEERAAAARDLERAAKRLAHAQELEDIAELMQPRVAPSRSLEEHEARVKVLRAHPEL